MRRRTAEAYVHRMNWTCGKRTLECGDRPMIMGVINVTPDSFSDGNRFFNADRAVERGVEMLRQGADILDVGGESTRPGAPEVPADEEKARVVPVISRLSGFIGANPEFGHVVVSVDTMKAEVAAAAVSAGASIINDVSALTHDGRMADVARESGAGVVLMHMQGDPRTMQKNPSYDDVTDEVVRYLRGRVESLVGSGMDVERIAVDPGIGFGKTLEHNLRLLGGLERFRAIGRPLVVGLSRKSMLGTLTGRPVDRRLSASVAGLAFSVARGAHIMRVHDVEESVDAARVAAAMESYSEDGVWPRPDGAPGECRRI